VCDSLGDDIELPSDATPPLLFDGIEELVDAGVGAAKADFDGGALVVQTAFRGRRDTVSLTAIGSTLSPSRSTRRSSPPTRSPPPPPAEMRPLRTAQSNPPAPPSSSL